MSDTALALTFAAAAIIFLFAWIPTLNLCNAACQRLFLRGRYSTQVPDLREEENPRYIQTNKAA